MAKIEFDWDDENIAHLARHGITTGEAEYVVRSPRSRSERSRSTTFPITFGRTKGGKFIAVVWSALGTNPVRTRVITACEVDKPEGGP